MKLHTIILILIALLPSVRAEIAWTHRAEEGEDATSTFHYFYQSNGKSVNRVRSVWNGGAQNSPTLTEYIFESGGIHIRHLKGNRAQVEDLAKGRDCELELEREYFIKNANSSAILLPPAPEQHLSDSQRSDLSNLIYLLAMERKPIQKTKAEQDGNGQPATRRESKSEARDKPQPESERRSR